MEKIRIEQATAEHAEHLVRLLRSEQPELVKRWIDLERIDQGVEEISAPVRKFITDHADVPHSNIKIELFMAMREPIVQLIEPNNNQSRR